MTAHRCHVRRAPDADRAALAAVQIRRLQELFEVNRELGIHTSPYPQLGYCEALECQVREVRPKDMIR